MLNNSWSIAILIASGALIICALCSKKLKRMYQRDITKIKDDFENLNEQEKMEHNKNQQWSILFIEILFWVVLLAGALFTSTKV